MMDWRLFAFGSAAFAALTAILAKIGVAGVNSDAATFFRTAVALAITGAFVLGRGAWPTLYELTTRNVIFLTLSGAATGLSWLCYFRALESGPFSKVAPIDKLSVVIVVIVAALFLRETMTFKVIAGTVLVSCGVFLLAR